MRAIKIKFNGEGNTSIDWNNQVDGATGVAQRAAVSVMTQLGSDKTLPKRGTNVTKTLLSYGVFDLLGMQHLLNFGGLKAVSDMQAYEATDRDDASKVAAVQMTLIDVKDNTAQVGITVTNAAGQKTNEITRIS